MHPSLPTQFYPSYWHCIHRQPVPKPFFDRALISFPPIPDSLLSMQFQVFAAAILVFPSVLASETEITWIPLQSEKYLQDDKSKSFCSSSTSHVNESYRWLASRGVMLKDYRALHHPSQPNYISSVSGHRFGVETDLSYTIPSQHKTIVELLDAKNISWGLYQEDMPYCGYEGDYYNKAGKRDYVRKHNPLISYQSVMEKPSDAGAGRIKNFTKFYEDLENERLPQWMFITPNMTNNGHDTSTTFGLAWAQRFLTPLLKDPRFMKNTLILLTWDEYENAFVDLFDGNENKVSSLLLGDAIPAKLRNTTKVATKGGFTHYSIMSTVEKNWDLGNLTEVDGNAEPFWP
ncbi:putative acid phosphatase [Lachnellula suecica]|uniref:Putative acid phosphatase n=1 Tax=Lachnellula suecica TaxID=602035 RepID=A0A8T9CDE1_9HELO|nr:putative acid phosphatase [Lachnellula suecica]